MELQKDYLITTGYYSDPNDKFRPKFFDIWYRNTLLYSKPKKVIVVSANSAKPKTAKGEWVNCLYNFGHVHDLDKDPIYKFCGWSVGYLTGAMLAYANNCDFIYKEQDCLAFGYWIDHMYAIMKKSSTQMLVGELPKGFIYGLEQSLTIIKHEFILKFVEEWLKIPNGDSGDMRVRLRPEQKFLQIKNNYPNDIGWLPFGVGRYRPINFSSKSFYFQAKIDDKWDMDLIEECKQKKLI